MKYYLTYTLLVMLFSTSVQANNRAICGAQMRAAANAYCKTSYTVYMFAKMGSQQAVRTHIRNIMVGVCNRYCSGIVPCNKNYNTCSALKSALRKIKWESFNEDTEKDEIDYLFLDLIEESGKYSDIQKI